MSCPTTSSKAYKLLGCHIWRFRACRHRPFGTERNVKLQCFQQKQISFLDVPLRINNVTANPIDRTYIICMFIHIDVNNDVAQYHDNDKQAYCSRAEREKSLFFVRFGSVPSLGLYMPSTWFPSRFPSINFSQMLCWVDVRFSLSLSFLFNVICFLTI